MRGKKGGGRGQGCYMFKIATCAKSMPRWRLIFSELAKLWDAGPPVEA